MRGMSQALLLVGQQHPGRPAGFGPTSVRVMARPLKCVSKARGALVAQDRPSLACRQQQLLLSCSSAAVQAAPVAATHCGLGCMAVVLAVIGT
jgi:hypothetical protein